MLGFRDELLYILAFLSQIANSTTYSSHVGHRTNTMCALATLILLLFATAAFCAVDAVPTSSDFREQCLSFTPEKFIKNSTRTHLEYVTKNTTLKFPDNVASCGRPRQKVDTNICRIALSIPTSSRSSITFELWLPENWSENRYISTGNGGIDGCL